MRVSTACQPESKPSIYTKINWGALPSEFTTIGQKWIHYDLDFPEILCAAHVYCLNDFNIMPYVISLFLLFSHIFFSQNSRVPAWHFLYNGFLPEIWEKPRTPSSCQCCGILTRDLWLESENPRGCCLMNIFNVFSVSKMSSCLPSGLYNLVLSSLAKNLQKGNSLTNWSCGVWSRKLHHVNLTG